MLSWPAAAGLAPPPSAATAASVGRVACDGRELLVLGTAHTPCASAAEARALVAAAKPDVLMLEIDQERLDALLQRGSSLYGVPLGAEFAAAFEEGEGVGAIPVLGDAKVTRADSRSPCGCVAHLLPSRDRRETRSTLCGWAPARGSPIRSDFAARFGSRCPSPPPTTSRSKPSTSRRPFAKIRTR